VSGRTLIPGEFCWTLTLFTENRKENS